MMKKLVYISILSLLLLSSCRSKRMITVSLPQQRKNGYVD